MTASELLSVLRGRGVRLWVAAGELRYGASGFQFQKRPVHAVHQFLQLPSSEWPLAAVAEVAIPDSWPENTQRYQMKLALSW